MESVPTGAGGEQGREVAVLGLGNVLMGDDALGPFVVQLLQAHYDFPPGVSVIDAGTPGLDLTPFILGTRALVVVDTVKADGPPGTLRLYRKDELLATPPAPRLSPHDPGLKETLLLLDFRGDGPSDVLLVGVVPGVVDTRLGLGPELRSVLPAVERAVVDELTRLGVPARRREAPAEPEPWWERPPGA
ncbi:MAG: hydrogenase maturation protease [Acidobacteriota bacterium]